MTPRLSRNELAIVAALALTGAALRFWNCWFIGLNHFDEGVYTFSALGIADSRQPHLLYPGQMKFSPLVFPALVGLAFQAFGGPSDFAAAFPSLAAGSMTVLLLWWIGRTWFGPAAGVAAAAMTAMSQYHIALSRAVLTDVCFAAIFVTALYAINRAFRTERMAWAIFGGLLTGLAWNTKYHGWFTLIIAGACLVPALWRWRQGEPFPARAVRILVVIGVVALCCYGPWLVYIQSQPGGYAELAKYQRTMLSRHYAQNLFGQAAMQDYWEGPLSRASVPIALACALLMTGARLTARIAARIIAVSLLSMFAGAWGTAALLSLAAIPAIWRTYGRFPGLLLIAWMMLWVLATPLYHPYSRLALPFTLATFLGTGVWMMQSLANDGAARIRWQPVLAASACACLVFMFSRGMSASELWAPAHSFQFAAAEIESIVPAGSRVIVIGEPALAFYLHRDGRRAFERTETLASLEQVSTEVYLATGLYTRLAPELRDAMQILKPRLTPLRTVPLRPNEIRLVDDLTPVEARAFKQHPDGVFDVTLYRFAPLTAAAVHP
jgi:4-amino-4-deoxy-L-arabinose transferase-like glycosyltransferase